MANSEFLFIISGFIGSYNSIVNAMKMKLFCSICLL